MCQHWFSHPALFWHFLSISLHLPLDFVSVFLLTSHDTMAQSSLLPLTWGISIQRGQYVEVGGHFPNALGNVLWNKDSLCKPYYSNCRLKQLFFPFFFSPCVNDLSKESMKWDDGRKLFSLPEGCCLPQALSWTERKAGVLQPCSTSLFPEFWDITLPGKSQGIPLLPTSPLLGIKFLFKRN